MQDPLVVRRLLERMAEGVTKVEAHAEARLSLIRRNHVALPPSGALHDLSVGSVFMQLWVARNESRRHLFEQREESILTEQCNLHRLTCCGNDLSCGEGAQRIQVGDDGEWLMEGADEILPFREIDAGLSAE